MRSIRFSSRALILGCVAFSLSLLWLESASAFRASELKFYSKQDSFTLLRSGSGYSLDGKRVDLGPFKEFLGHFDTDLDESCPSLPKRSDLTVVAKTSKGDVRRRFYIKSKVMSDGHGCLDVGGQGIYFLPFHRHWFKKDTIVRTKIGKRIVIFQEGREILNFVKQDGEWRNSNAQFFTNWSFFNDFHNALKEYRVEARVHSDMAKSMPDFASQEFRVRTGGKEYVFSRVGDKQWAAKLPKTPWLVTSNNWSFFENMDLSMWKDPNSARLETIMNKTLPPEQRSQAIDSLKSLWSKSIKHTLQNILLDSEEPTGVKLDALSRLRKHPSDDNMKALARALSKTDDAEVQYQITRSLRIRNPRGTIISEEADSSERAKLISEWQRWAKALK